MTAAPSTTSRLRMAPQTHNTLSMARTDLKDFALSNIDVKQTLNIAIDLYDRRSVVAARLAHLADFVGHTGLPVNITQTNEIPGSSQRPNGNPQLLKLANPTKNGAALQYLDSATDPSLSSDSIRAGLQHHQRRSNTDRRNRALATSRATPTEYPVKSISMPRSQRTS